MACQACSDNAPTPEVVYENEAIDDAPPDENPISDTPILDTQDAGIADIQAANDSGNNEIEPIIDSGTPSFGPEADSGPVGDTETPWDAGTQEACVDLDNPSYFAQKVWGEELSDQCIGCHNANGTHLKR